MAAITTLAAVPVCAETNVVTCTSVNAYNAANVLARRSDGPLAAEDAEIIKRAVLADTRVDDGERAMLNHLIEGETFLIKHPKQDRERQFNRIASDDAKEVLRHIQAFSYDDPILQSWMEATPESVGHIVAMYDGTAEERQQALTALIQRARAVNKIDSHQNDYRKLKGEAAAWSSRCNTLSGEIYASCIAMIYEAMLEADKDGRTSHEGNIPDFIYNQWKPKED